MQETKDGSPSGQRHQPNHLNFFVSGFNTSAELNASYADDNHAAAIDSDLDIIAEDLTTAAGEMASQAEACGMSLSASKSTATLFTP